MRALKARPLKEGVSAFRVFKARPLFGFALAVILYSIIYYAVYHFGSAGVSLKARGGVTGVLAEAGESDTAGSAETRGRIASGYADKGSDITVVGRVTDKTVDLEGNITSFEIKVNRFTGTSEQNNVTDQKTWTSDRCICYVNKTVIKDNAAVKDHAAVKDCAAIKDDDVPYGAIVEASGEMGFFKRARNPGEFDSYMYHANHGSEYYVNLKGLSIVSKPRFPIRERFHRLRNRFTRGVLEYCPLEGETINTLLFADKSGLDETRKELYKGSGIRHFLVLSGLHFSLAGGGIYVLFRKTGLKRYKCALMSIVFVLLYGCLVGFTISVLRAVIMFLMRLVADAINRSYDILSALSLACAVTLITNPLYIGDSAFLYSYVAVFSIAFFYTYLFREFEKRVYQRVFDRTSLKARAAKLKEALIIPFVIYFSLIGLSLRFQFYSNLLSIPLNLLLGVLSPIVIVFSALAWGGAMLRFRLFAGIFDFLLALILWMFDGLSALIVRADPFKIIYKPSLFGIAVYAVILVLVVFLFARRGNKNLSVLWLLSAVLVCFSPSFARFNVTFLSVGQGDGSVIRLDKRHAIIVDCGSSSEQNVGENVLVPFLMAEGITEITDIYLSHSDADHINGIAAAIEDPNIRVRRVVLPDAGSAAVESPGGDGVDAGNEGFKEIIEACEKQGTDVTVIRAGAVVTYGDCRRGDSRKNTGKARGVAGPMHITCLWPDRDRLIGDKNADSMVLWLSRGRFDAIFPGDATAETESRMVLRPPWLASEDSSVEVYKCAHHGSSTSSSSEWMFDMRPAITVISCGFNNRYGHPHAVTLETLAKCGSIVYRTDHSGAVTVTPGARKISVKTYRGG